MDLLTNERYRLMVQFSKATGPRKEYLRQILNNYYIYDEIVISHREELEKERILENKQRLLFDKNKRPMAIERRIKLQQNKEIYRKLNT